MLTEAVLVPRKALMPKKAINVSAGSEKVCKNKRKNVGGRRRK